MISKKILIVARNFYPSLLGGSCTALYNLARGLSEAGMEVSVLTTNDSIDSPVTVNQWIEIGSIKVFYCNVHSSNNFHLALLNNLRASIKSADTVCFGSFFYVPNMVAALWARLYGKKIVWSPRGELFRTAIGGSFVKKFYVKLIKLFFGKYACFHGTSDAEVDIIRTFLGPNVNIAKIENYFILPPQAERHPNSPYFLFVGRVAPIKALSKIVEGISLSKLFRKRGYSFIIAGQVLDEFKSYYDEVERLIEKNGLREHVKYIGPIAGIEKDKLFADAYMTLLLSESENFGNVVVESLAQGTPVMASIGTPWEVLSKKKIGLWISNDPEVIARNLDYVIDMDNKEYESMRKNSRDFCLKNYSMADNVNKWISVI